MNTILEALKNEKTRLETELRKVNHALAIFAPNGNPTAARKPMSEEAKKRIAEGLKKAREAKGVTATAPAAPVAAPVPQAPSKEAAPESKPGTPKKAEKPVQAPAKA